METLGFNSPPHNPENVLPQWQQKIANAKNIANPYCRGLYRFSAQSAIFCRYWTCTFSGRSSKCSFVCIRRRGPIMGTALAAYRQCIGAEVVCYFHRQRKVLRFPKVFEDERSLAGGEVTLSFSVASLD